MDSDIFPGLDYLELASIKVGVLREFYRASDFVAVEVSQVAEAVQVLLLVL
jgi:hypothetical protein